jgi:transposase-like protein
MRFSEIAGRLNGVSTPIFGVSWTPPVSDVAVAREVIIFMEDKRVLYSPSDVEVPDHCVQSVIDMRRFLTEILGRGGLNDELTGPLRRVYRDSDASLAQVAKDFGISPSCLKRWITIDDRNSTTPSPAARAASESEALREANKRIKLLEQENEVLRRAAAYLSQAHLPGK